MTVSMQEVIAERRYQDRENVPPPKIESAAENIPVEPRRAP
jgi:hypothetical protein